MEIKSLCEVCEHAIRLKNQLVGCIKSKGIIPDQMDDIEDCNDFEVQEEES
jgi:hypothetical protein